MKPTLQEMDEVFGNIAEFHSDELHGANGSGVLDGLVKRGGEPIPLYPELAPAADYPLEALASLAPATKAIASKIQVPCALAAQSVLAASSLAAQAVADVVLPYGQTRPLSLNLLTVAYSGDRKSSSDNEAQRPIRMREATLREQYDAKIADFRISQAAWAAQKRKIENDRAVETVADRKAELSALGPEPIPPILPILLAPEPTIEGLAKTWVQAPGSLGLFSSEGGQLTGGHGFSPEHRLRTAAGLSVLWDGNGMRRVRAADGLTDLRGRRLAAHIMIQPDAAAAFLSDPVLRDQGLLSRFLIAAPASLGGTRLFRETKEADELTIRRYVRLVLDLLETAWPHGEQANELTPRPLTLSAEAKRVWIAFHNATERAISSEGPLHRIRDSAAKAAEQAARIAGVLTVISDPRASEIDIDAMTGGSELATWYLGEAARLADAALLDPALKNAQALLEWLRTRGPQVSLREICHAGPSPVRKKAAAEKALGILADHGWVSLTKGRQVIVTWTGGIQ